MNDLNERDKDRWDELQIAHLLEGLSPEEQTEYETIAQKIPPDQSERFEHVVASLDVAWSDPQAMSLPEHLRKTIRAQAEAELTSRNPLPETRPASARQSRQFGFTYLPWLVAAASLLFSVFSLNSSKPTNVVNQDISQLRAGLISSSPDLIQLDWAKGPTPIEGAGGDVVWSPSRQEGYMRFRGLSVNDPATRQYQLWIFDKNQSDKTPIDGGVFDIRSDGEVIVPIHAKLRVQEVVLFAITIEKPGGVVVSSREQLPLLAAVN